MTGVVEYKSGENVYIDVNSSTYYKYGDNYSGYHWDYSSDPPECNPNDITCVKLFHDYTTGWTNTTTTYEYTTLAASYQSVVWWFGFLLALTSGIGAFALFYDLKSSYDVKQESYK